MPRTKQEIDTDFASAGEDVGKLKELAIELINDQTTPELLKNVIATLKPQLGGKRRRRTNKRKGKGKKSRKH